MEEVVLEFPSDDHEDRANLYKEEFFLHNEPVINGSALFDRMDYKQWLDMTQKIIIPKRTEKTGLLPPPFLPSERQTKRLSE